MQVTSRHNLTLVVLLLAGIVGGCEPDDRCRKYSIHTCEELQKIAQFNVHFYYPQSNQEEYLGQVRGLSNCQSRAGSFSIEKQLQTARWDYICCLKTEKSRCAERHK